MAEQQKQTQRQAAGDHGEAEQAVWRAGLARNHEGKGTSKLRFHLNVAA